MPINRSPSNTRLPEVIRFFARARTIELACPRCDKVFILYRRSPRRIWNPRTARFECSECQLTLYLGVIAWGAGFGGPPHYEGNWVPRDHTPTVKQALDLRHELSVAALKTRRRRGQDMNVIVAEMPGEEPEGEGQPNDL